jgi:hypothetical protein
VKRSDGAAEQKGQATTGRATRKKLRSRKTRIATHLLLTPLIFQVLIMENHYPSRGTGGREEASLVEEIEDSPCPPKKSSKA